MKTLNQSLNLKNRFFQFLIITILGMISFHEVNGQDLQNKSQDFILPSKGSSLMGLSLGFLSAPDGTVTYGLNNRLSIGISAGITGGLESILFGSGGLFGTSSALNCGIGLNALLSQPTDKIRIYMTVPLLYGFKSKSIEPFILITPMVNVEWKLRNGTRIWVGSGVQQVINPGYESSYNIRSNISNIGVAFPIEGKSFIKVELNPAGLDLSLRALFAMKVGFSFSL